MMTKLGTCRLPERVLKSLEKDKEGVGKIAWQNVDKAWHMLAAGKSLESMEHANQVGMVEQKRTRQLEGPPIGF